MYSFEANRSPLAVLDVQCLEVVGDAHSLTSHQSIPSSFLQTIQDFSSLRVGNLCALFKGREGEKEGEKIAVICMVFLTLALDIPVQLHDVET